MIKNKKILAIIPARGGSKGLPNKNIKELLGKPLLVYTIDQAKESKYIDEIFLSTDSSYIAQVSENYGLHVPILRPNYLASDTSSSVDVVLHVIDYYENKGIIFDFVILLEPTSPLRKKNDIDSAILKVIDSQYADGIISIGEVHMEHPMIVKRINSKGYIESYVLSNSLINRRQELDKAYFPYGILYMIKTSTLKLNKTFYTQNIIPYFIERWQNFEIDDIYDFIIIESLLMKLQEEKQ
jgi:CMP-N-acetylneuraminic acid synthetase